MTDALRAVGDIRDSLHLPGLATRLSQRLEQLILQGLLKPGSRLVEETLARELGISRTSLREAVLVLEQSGLIVRVERNTRVIRTLDEQDVRELYELWAILESEAAAAACLVATEEDRAAIRRLIVAMEKATAGTDYHLINLDFHSALVAPCPNRRLIETYAACLKQIRWAWALAIAHVSDLRESRREHRQIVRAYLARDAAAVRELCRAHINSGSLRAGIGISAGTGNT
jgi:DNA-binding GntR family transcriptional regulator